ncbi:MAG: Holliday junction resolvase RuvX [Actinobacteria bacterium]|uniref:Unannotated protein n=1 Tax=freshwater metagenome TaxID=449393 RepID=A0A6J5YNA1_9ZZZZ|nr:Holliday junction resolvase RuvX [Actinomycetota bacterium]
MDGARLSIDVGTARIGVARCDDEQLLVVPVATIASGAEAVAEIVALCDLYRPAVIYVGYPISLSGSVTNSTNMATSFAIELSQQTEIPVRMLDERLSTATALGQLRQSGRNAKQGKSVIDQAAAIVILEQALAIEKRSGNIAGTSIGESP